MALLFLLVIVGVSKAVLGEDVAPSTPASTTFWHSSLLVDDMDRMRSFYTDVVGLREGSRISVQDTTRSDTAGVVIVPGFDQLLGLNKVRVVALLYGDRDSEYIFELIKHVSHPSERVARVINSPLGWNHIGFRVASIDSTVAQMKRLRLGEIVGKSIRTKRGRYVFLKDPEGNMIELLEEPETPTPTSPE